MKTSQQGIDFIKGHESLRLTAYRCTSGVLTIGYGHTGNVKPGQVITAMEAERLLQEDLATAEQAVNRLMSVELKQNQFDALVSFTFNVGAGAFKGSTLLFVINQKRSNEAIENQFKRWIYSDGKPSAGLKRRRAEESAIFINGYSKKS